MHFRHLLISGLMVGAVLFLPDNASAAKSELSGPQNSQKASAQVNPSVGMDNAAVKSNVSVKEKAVVTPEAVKPNVSVKEKAVVAPRAVKPNVSVKEKAVVTPIAVKPNVPAKEKAVAAPNSTMKNQGGIKQQPSKVPPNNSASQKSATASKNLPNQAKGNVQSILNKTEKAVNKAHEPKKVAAVQVQNNGLGKNMPISENRSGNSDLNSLHNAETKVKKQVQLVSFEPQGEDIDLSAAKKEKPSEPLLQDPQEKGGIPSDEEEIPKGSQVLNPTQRTSINGGPSNDRVGQGLSAVSFLDKWFVWNPYYEIQFVESYLSQHTWLNNQWVNAPPSPPPQEAPLLETVTRS